MTNNIVEVYNSLVEVEFNKVMVAINETKELTLEEGEQMIDEYKRQLSEMHPLELRDLYEMNALFIADENIFIDEAYLVQDGECIGWKEIKKEMTKEQAMEMYSQGYDTLSVREKGDYFAKDLSKNSFMEFFQIKENTCPFQQLPKRQKNRMEALECELKPGINNGFKMVAKGVAKGLEMAYITSENQYKKGEMLKINYFYGCNLYTISIKRDEFSEWVCIDTLNKIVDVKKLIWSL